ncbi:hypothetical protein ES703_76562 [subsurface metagenome]
MVPNDDKSGQREAKGRDITPKTIEIAAEICFKCGVCCVINDHSCHAQHDAQFNPRHTFVYDCLGSGDPPGNPNIWLCVSCHKCEELCPYEVSPVHIIESLKAQAFEEGRAHPMIVSEVQQIVTTGYAFPLTGSSSRQREKLGLDPVTQSSLEDLTSIAEKTGLAAKLERYREVEK